MSDNRRMSSIAHRINKSYMRRTVWMILLCDLLLCALLAGTWCYAAEEASGGFQTKRQRNLAWDSSVPFPERVDTITYTFETENGEMRRVSGQAYFSLCRRGMPFLLIGEALIVLHQHRAGKKRAQKLLQPLERMAETALEMSRTRFDREKLHTLENAIAGVNPDAPDTVLHTGDRELQGLEKAVNDLMGRMRLSYQEQTRFVSDASHELRTPIAVIQGYADMLSRWGKDDPTVLEEGIAAIKSESAHMNKLIEQLLFLARGDSGRTRMTMENTDLSALVKEVHEEFGMIHPERNWRLQADTPVWAVCDYAMIKQTLRILTENAVKYTAEADTVTLRARMHKGMPALEVQDNGIGIAEKDLPRIFDRFYRADPNRTRKTGGTGLGLSIAKWIVEQHSGHFDVLSRPDFGTRITVCLPQKKDGQISK